MTDLAAKLSEIAERAFNMSITPDEKNAFYDIRVLRHGIAIEAKWDRAMNYRHVTGWAELDANHNVLDYAFELVKNIVEHHKP